MAEDGEIKKLEDRIYDVIAIVDKNATQRVGFANDHIKDLTRQMADATKEIADLKSRVKDLEAKMGKMKK